MKQILLFLSVISSTFNFAQDGTIDPNYITGTGFDGTAYHSYLQSDGKLIVVGGFFFYNGSIVGAATRLNQDGTVDNTFNCGAGINTGENILKIRKQTDGKFLVCGDFTQYDLSSSDRIARMNSDGSADLSFDAGSTFNSAIRDMAIQSDGKIIVVGFFSGTNKNYIARLNSNGTLDTSFNSGSGFNNTTRSVTIDSNGKIIVTGSFSTYNGTAANTIVRLNSDGTIDSSFNSGTGANNRIEENKIQTDGKILIMGAFTDYNGTTVGRFARLNIDGSLDTTFLSGTAANNQGTHLFLDNINNKIYLAGVFLTYNGTTVSRIIRLNIDGSLDTTFIPGASIDSGIAYSIAVQSDNKIIILGSFPTYQGITKNNIVRIGDASLSAPTNTFTSELNVYPNPANDIVTIDISSNGTIEVYDIVGKLVKTGTLTNGQNLINISDLNKGVYLAKITNELNQTKTIKIIKN